MSVSVISWSYLLTAIASINVIAWAMSAKALWARREWLDQEVFAARRLQLLLAAGYVFGCAYRSLLPVFDVPRIALVDSPLATAAVGRSVATVAELCFIAQWALLMRFSSKATGSGFAEFASRALIPMIVVAELCSWYSVLTTSNLGHVFEESLWSVATALIVASLLVECRRFDLRSRKEVAWLVAAGSVYLLYLVVVDVPMYWSRWVADELAGKPTLSFAQGWLDASRPHTVSYDWDVWKSEMAWMTTYFSVGVWASLWLIHAPLPHASRRRATQRPALDLPGVAWRRFRI